MMENRIEQDVSLPKTERPVGMRTMNQPNFNGAPNYNENKTVKMQ